MEITAVVDRVGRIGAVRADDAAGRVECESALVELRGLRAWVDASEADLARRLAAMVSFPEQAIAESSKGSLGQASGVMERAATLESTPAIAAALDRGAVTAGHVDAITRAGKTLDPSPARGTVGSCRCAGGCRGACQSRRSSLGGCVTKPAACKPPTAWTSWNANGERRVCARGWMWRACGTSRPASIRSPVSDSTPGCVSTLEALFATSTPDTCPTDPGAKQDHLRALALADLILTGGGTVQAGRPEYLVVVDADTRRPERSPHGVLDPRRGAVAGPGRTRR